MTVQVLHDKESDKGTYTIDAIAEVLRLLLYFFVEKKSDKGDKDDNENISSCFGFCSNNYRCNKEENISPSESMLESAYPCICKEKEHRDEEDVIIDVGEVERKLGLERDERSEDKAYVRGKAYGSGGEVAEKKSDCSQEGREYSYGVKSGQNRLVREPLFNVGSSFVIERTGASNIRFGVVVVGFPSL